MRRYWETHREELNAKSRERNRRPEIRAKLRARELAYRQTPEGWRWNRNKMLLNRYHITLIQYEQILEDQNGVCAICGESEIKPNSSLGVDHNHKCCSGRISCGKCIRGLLCYKCNTRLQLIESGWTEKAVKYLNEFR